MFVTVLIIFVSVSSTTSTASDDTLTTFNANGIGKDDGDVISFDLPTPPPKYPQGGGFGLGSIDLGGLQVYEALVFKKIWATNSGGPDDLGASFYEPTNIPSGYNLLGHYSRPNSVPLYAAVLTAKDTTGDPLRPALKSPINYIRIWSSKGLNISNEGDGYIWLPIPPDGYKAVGHIITSLDKPSLDKVWCVRSDFTDLLEVDTWIWGQKGRKGYIDFNVYSTKPLARGLSVPTGTFLARIGESHTHYLACLKMVKNDPYYAMPNSLQISAMINAYAPQVYFHPDEEYLPSTVLWFFENGALLHKTGSNPCPVINDGDNLPNNGSADDAFLDLPPDQADKDKVKKGFLPDAMAYIHVKPALGATFTDLAIWLYYPFNGGGKFQLGPFTINLGKIGEHVSDWEHFTLRIDNFRGMLKAIYLSQHAAGKWVNAQEFSYLNGTRPVVYASLHGHSHYATPSYHMHTEFDIDQRDIEELNEALKMYSKSPIIIGDKFLGFGVRDDTAKSDKVMDIASNYQVVCVDYKALDMEPWLYYTGRWGPKITYKFVNEAVKAANHLPNKIKALAIRILHKLPPELLGQEGPDGPKMRESWTGDEKV